MFFKERKVFPDHAKIINIFLLLQLPPAIGYLNPVEDGKCPGSSVFQEIAVHPDEQEVDDLGVCPK